jgi:5-methylthioadenosine/S-adenosylhomocysteine deaminase
MRPLPSLTKSSCARPAKRTELPKRPPIDPAAGEKFALSGRVVTMDDHFSVIDRGVVYIDEGRVAWVLPQSADPPQGFEDVEPVASGGTIFPGLIELHNHLAYNALRLWDVPTLFTNRDAWGRVEDYRRLVSGPMQVLGPDPQLMPAVVRWVECKCLVSGTTTSQGIELFSNQGSRRYYRGNVRNVEVTDDPELPHAETKISDVDAAKAASFLKRLGQHDCFILHLSEGTDQAARDHFLALKLPGGKWALAPSLAGIHAAALEQQDFEVLAEHECSMVWSPLSNLLLYGATAKVEHAKGKVRIGLGSDWSPTGSKNLLGELKVAKVVSDEKGGLFEDHELVAMATRDAARILRWEAALGSIEKDKRADLLVVNGTGGDPYRALLRADETDLRAVLVGGVPRFGFPGLLRRLGAGGEELRIDGKKRVLNLKQATADPAVGKISLAQARERLTDALRRLKELRKEQERRGLFFAAAPGSGDPTAPLQWALALDELQETGTELRPRVALHDGQPTGPELQPLQASKPLSEILGPLKLDPLTVADHRDEFLEQIGREPNLPGFVAPGLRRLYAR